MGDSSAYRESKSFVLRGLFLLGLGSVLLLLCKLPVPELYGYAFAFIGGAILLYGNGCIVYGLLIFAGNRAP